MHCRVKICGITSIADALAAARLGADVVGLNFYAPSPRCIDETTARDILEALPTSVAAAMLSVNETWDATLERAARLPGLSSLQIHRTAPTPAPLRTTLPWVPAFAVKDESSLAAILRFLDECRCAGGALPAAILVDAHAPGAFGGTGQTLPWDLLEGFAPDVPMILAGGLTPDNVAEAIRRVRPMMVDVASGVESSPGRKDIEKMKRFLDAVRGA